MKTQNPWMGRARGSAGNMTSSKVYDKNVMRAKAFEVNNPNTTAQQTERNFFKEIQEIVSKITEEQLRSLFPTLPKNKSRRNALMSQLLALFVIRDSKKYFAKSKIETLGNGKKTTLPKLEDVGAGTLMSQCEGWQEFKQNTNGNAPIFIIGVGVDNTLVIKNTQLVLDDLEDDSVSAILGFDESESFYGYITTDYNQNNEIESEIGKVKLYSRIP